VTNPATPPELMWRLDENDADFSEMGLSFSAVKFAIIQYEDTPRVAAVFGGGYNGGWDDTLENRVGKDVSAAADTKGNAIYIVNVADGDLIWKAVNGASTGVVTGSVDSSIKVVYAHDELIDSIPSKVEVVDTNFDGIDDRIYVGDTGGSLWRVDMPVVNEDDTDCGTECTSRKENWFISKLAQLDYGSLGDTSVASGDRRFFHAPDVVLSEDANGRFWGVAIGSGNRADPLDTVVDDWFFLIKDRLLTSGDTTMRQDNASSFANYTFDQLQSTQACIVACSVDIDKGWKLPMGVVGSSDGEKILSQPVISTGINDTAEIFFTSYVPTGGASSCEPSVGTGRVYIAGLEYGQPTRFLGGGVSTLGVTDRFEGGIMGIPPGVVRIGDYNMTPGGRFFETGADIRNKVYWRDIGVDYIK
jgi:type IV pilus assembly protein PilY1